MAGRGDVCPAPRPVVSSRSAPRRRARLPELRLSRRRPPLPDLNRRNQRASTIVTTNLPFKDWAKLFTTLPPPPPSPTASSTRASSSASPASRAVQIRISPKRSLALLATTQRPPCTVAASAPTRHKTIALRAIEAPRFPVIVSTRCGRRSAIGATSGRCRHSLRSRTPALSVTHPAPASRLRVSQAKLGQGGVFFASASRATREGAGWPPARRHRDFGGQVPYACRKNGFLVSSACVGYGAITSTRPLVPPIRPRGLHPRMDPGPADVGPGGGAR